MAYLIPYINITSSDNDNKNDYIGKLKHDINKETIEIMLPHMKKNKDFVDYVIASNYNFIPLRDYYNDVVAEFFDIYGGEFKTTVNDIIYTIQIYFYKIKNIELLTQKVINKFKNIFMYDYFVKNNILDMTWHNYRLNKYFIEKLNKKNFLDLSYIKPDYCNTDLFAHQKHNLARMFNIHNNPINIKISDNMPIYFENELIYDMVKEEFISEDDIPTFHINSGMILDEPGTGKTLQFILYLLEMNIQYKLCSLILVPNNNIKLVWMDELNKHINPSTFIPFNIMIFNELEETLNIDETYLNHYQIIGIDEIHNLYNKPKLTGNLFNKIITSSIKYRWGITGTPFVSDNSFFKIIKFLTGNNSTILKNERIANNPLIQDQLIKLFLKNCKTDIVEYQWPELNIQDVYVKLDIVQQKMYDAENMLNHDNTRLRQLVCEINLMFSEGEFNTPSELKQYGIKHYQQLYEIEQVNLIELKSKLENIIVNSDKFEENEYAQRVMHYKQLIHNQTEKTTKHKKVSDFIMSAIENINKLVTQSDHNEDNEDSRCPICWDNYNAPISYIKSCGHYFCKACLDGMRQFNSNISCPKCRNKFDNSNIINVQQMSDINNSSKIHELLNIINYNDSKYIIFTQFDKVIDKIKFYLTRNNITSETYNNYNGEQVLLLSSQQNAEGINLSSFDNMIIFEPFEYNVYCNQVEKQLIARIHRIGRSKTVNIYRFITEGTIEEAIYKLTSLSK